MKKLILSLLMLLSFYLFPQEIILNGNTNSDTILKYKYFIIDYNKKVKEPNYVSFIICKKRLTQKVNRTDNFRPDKKLNKKLSASLYSYKIKGYDRGHLAPAEDMRFDSIAMNECFYLTNMAVQNASFNRGKWKELESACNKLAQKYDTILVVSGVIYDDSCKYPISSRDPIVTPCFFYKFIYINKLDGYLAFIFSNADCDEDIEEYAITSEFLEKNINYTIPIQFLKRQLKLFEIL